MNNNFNFFYVSKIIMDDDFFVLLCMRLCWAVNVRVCVCVKDDFLRYKYIILAFVCVCGFVTTKITN